MDIRVFLIDDHVLVRTGMRMMLEAQSDMVLAGEAGSGEEGLPLVRQLQPDVVLCDLHLPGISVLPAVRVFIDFLAERLPPMLEAARLHCREQRKA